MSFEAPALIGPVVNWYGHADRNTQPCPALVLSQRRGGLMLAVLKPNKAQVLTLDGVLHVNDPELQRLPDNAVAMGGWDLLPADVALKAQIDALTAQVAELTEAVTASA